MKRRVYAVLVALALAAGPIVVVRTQWSEVCRLITPDNIFWTIFGCDINPPPGDPYGS